MADSYGTNPGQPPRWADDEDAPELVKAWRSPVFNQKFQQVPVFLLPRLAEMATEVPDSDLGFRIYYERAHCLLSLAFIAWRAGPATFELTEPPTPGERLLGSCIGQAFHQGCSLADVALATGLPAGQVIAIGKRTIRRTKWLSKLMAAHPDLAS
jgi:hypothetical protein